MKYCVACRETGDIIESFDTYKEAAKELKKFESIDKREKIYTPDFYDIIVQY